MTNSMSGRDVRQRAGWFPGSQDDLEAWLQGHRERAASNADSKPLHPVLIELQRLIDSDPVVRMYFERMITEVPRNRNYSQRHLTSVGQLLRLINEVLKLAPD